MNKTQLNRLAAEANSAQLQLPLEFGVPRDAAAEFRAACTQMSPPPASSVPGPDEAAGLLGPTTTITASSDARPAAPTSGAKEGAASEFAPLDALAPPGLDPGVLSSLQEQIEAELQPGNILERLVAQDITTSTVLGDHMFQRIMDAFACLAEDTARDLSGRGDDGGAASKLSWKQQVEARTLIDHYPIMAKLLQMHGMVQGSRNASIALFDTRRLNALKAALDALKS